LGRLVHLLALGRIPEGEQQLLLSQLLLSLLELSKVRDLEETKQFFVEIYLVLL